MTDEQRRDSWHDLREMIAKGGELSQEEQRRPINQILTTIATYAQQVDAQLYSHIIDLRDIVSEWQQHAADEMVSQGMELLTFARLIELVMRRLETLERQATENGRQLEAIREYHKTVIAPMQPALIALTKQVTELSTRGGT